MIASQAELLQVLRQYNPWWQYGHVPELPLWHRAAFHEIHTWMTKPSAHRALLISGARQIGKTTLLLQSIDALLKNGVSPGKILYVTFDHPLLKLVGLDGLLELWRELEPAREGAEYLFLDEIQYTKDWQTWIKHQVDFQKNRRIAITGSAVPLVTEGQESGVGRWYTIRLATLSFYEYLHLKSVKTRFLPSLKSLLPVFDWNELKFSEVSELAKDLVAHFHEYLLRGGFPQTVLVDNIPKAQKLLREDIVDKVLKRDMTALFGVRRVLELEQTFLYLCLHDGGLLDMVDLSKNLEVKKPTAINYINLLEATHLIYRLQPYGYGKEILRGRYKVYLADPAIAPGVLLKGKSLLEDETALGVAVETAVFKHLFTRYYRKSIGFSYWRGKKGREVDIIATIEGRHVPFEVKYRNHDTGAGELLGLQEFCEDKKISKGYVITKSMNDFGVLSLDNGVKLLKIPAPLFCYWLGQSEMEEVSDQD